MKQCLSHYLGAAVEGTDGPLGLVCDFYFDDQTWILTHLVCERSRQDGGERMLIPQASFQKKEWDLPYFPVALTASQALSCPRFGTIEPVSDQKFRRLNEWMVSDEEKLRRTWGSARKDYQHLRSFSIVRTYRLMNQGRIVGQMTDFVVENRDWTIPYWTVHGRHGGTFLVPPREALGFEWETDTVEVPATTDQWREDPGLTRKRGTR